MKPDSVVKDAMANAIVVAFPCLRDPKGTGHGAFYTKGRKRFPAFGWLEDHLRYVRKKQKRISSWNSSKREVPPKPCENEQGILSVKGELEDVSPEELVTMTEWLKHNLEPSTTVADYMRKTAGQRMRLIREDAKSVGEILLSYPRLLDPGMIEQDFDILNPGSKNLLYQKWELLAANIIAYADQINPNWSEVLQTPKDTHTCTNDEIKNLAFFLIPILFRGRSAKKGSCTVLNSLRSFIDVKPDVTSVEQYCTDIDKKDRPQPFVLCLGSNKLMPQQSFVIIERCPIVQSSLMSAIDFCFKCHYVFDISYQPQCKGAWEFLQSEIYDLGSVVNSSISMYRSFVTNQTSG